MSLLRASAAGSRCGSLLPLRAVLKKKTKSKVIKGKAVSSGGPLVPYLATQYVRDTLQFFKNPASVRGLLNLVFSPLQPKDSTADRAAFDKRLTRYRKEREAWCVPYEEQERRAEQAMFEAIKHLPREMWDEAVASDSVAMPRELLHHQHYREQLFAALLEDEKRKLQAFHILMHMRYPHSAIKKQSPHLFWATQTSVMKEEQNRR